MIPDKLNSYSVAMDSHNLQDQLRKAELRFNHAYNQIVCLNHKLDAYENSFTTACPKTQKSFRYNLRLQAGMTLGVRGLLIEYACTMADLVADLRYQLYGIEALEDMLTA